MVAPAMAAATWLVPTLDEATDDCDRASPFVEEPSPPLLSVPDEPALVAWEDGVEPGRLLDVTTEEPGEMATVPGGSSAPGGPLDLTGTGMNTTDVFVDGGGGDGGEDSGFR